MPNQLTQNINAFKQISRVRYDAFYAQEQWTLGRVTVQGALRFDYARSYFPEQTVGVQRFLPTSVTYPRSDGVTGYKDVAPRGGVAWDLFGTGKTSIKINAGKYVQNANSGLTYTALNPSGRLTTSVTRTWTDRDGDFVPDCDLLNPLAQRHDGRLLRSDERREFRQGPVHQHTRPQARQRVERPAGRLAIRRVGPTTGVAARLDRGRLQPALAHQLYVDRQPLAEPSAILGPSA